MPLELNPIKNELTYEMVARSIEEQILDRSVLPGDALPSEIAMAARLNVNRSTVREAIRMLEQNGLVRREPGRKKLRVSIPQSADLSRRLTSTIIIQKVSFEELYEAMYALEPTTAAGAAQRCDPSLMAALQENLALSRQAIDDRSGLTELDIEFHRLVACAARNGALELARAPLSELFYPAFYAVMSRLNAAERLLAAHEQIVAAIGEGDVARSRSWMERHIADFKRGYELANLDMSEGVERLVESHEATPSASLA